MFDIVQDDQFGIRALLCNEGVVTGRVGTAQLTRQNQTGQRYRNLFTEVP